jgi:O-antigen/teichoic acid export membrane protein
MTGVESGAWRAETSRSHEGAAEGALAAPERPPSGAWTRHDRPSETTARGGRLARNTLLNLAGMATPLAVGIVVIPILVRELGLDRFGLLSLLWVLLANLAAVNLGRVTTKFVAEVLAHGERSSVPRLVWTIATAQAVIGVVAALAFAAAAPALVDRLFDVPVDLRAEARTAFVVLAVAIPVMLVGTCFAAVLEAIQRFDLLNAVIVPSGAATVALPLLVVLLGGGLAEVVAALLMARIATALAFFLLSVRAFPRLGRPCAPSLAVAVRMRSFAGWLMVAGIVSPWLRYLDRYVLATLLSVSAVAYYSVAFDTIERLTMVSSAAALTVFPAFATFQASAAPARTHALFVFTLKALLITVAPVALGLAAWGPVLLRLWLGAPFAQHGAAAFQVLALVVPIWILAPIADAALQAYGRPDVIAKLYVIAFPVNALLVVVLIGALGVTGAALSMALRALVMAAVLLLITLRTIRLPLAVFAADLWRTLVLLGALGALLWTIATALDGAAIQVALASIVLALFGLGIWSWGLSGVERAQAWALLPRSAR